MATFRMKVEFDLEIHDHAAAEEFARQMLRDRPWDPQHLPLKTDDGSSEEVKIHQLAQEPRVQATMAASNLWLQGASSSPAWLEVRNVRTENTPL